MSKQAPSTHNPGRCTTDLKGTKDSNQKKNGTRYERRITLPERDRLRVTLYQQRYGYSPVTLLEGLRFHIDAMRCRLRREGL